MLSISITHLSLSPAHSPLFPSKSDNTLDDVVSVYPDHRLPVGHTGFVQRHEVDLTRRTTFGTTEEHLVVPLAQELEALGFLVHEHPVQVAGFDRTDLR